MMTQLTLLSVLTAAPPLVTIAYAALEFLGLFDKLTKRSLAAAGLARLRAPAGFPKSTIYNDNIDNRIFAAVVKRIQKRTTNSELQERFRNGEQATLIATAGMPCEITGVPAEWPQEARYFYSSEHPVLVAFGPVREGGKTGMAVRACSLNELEGWLTQERDRRRLIVGGILVGLISLTLIGMRLALSSDPQPEQSLPDASCAMPRAEAS